MRRLLKNDELFLLSLEKTVAGPVGLLSVFEIFLIEKQPAVFDAFITEPRGKLSTGFAGTCAPGLWIIRCQ